MIDRNRAWRRRKARSMFWRDQEKKRVVAAMFSDPLAKPIAFLKQHQHGKLTRVQERKMWHSLNTELSDALSPAIPMAVPG